MAESVAAITGLSAEEAAGFLEMAGGDVEAAVALFLRQRRQRASVGKISAKCCSFSAVSAPILQENMRFAAFFKIYQILKLKFLKFDKILQILRHLHFFC